MTKVVILAGGLGTRLSEETTLKPKPMVEIAGKPILWHIMKYYAHFGFKEFIICGGYKQYVIKEYFANYNRHNRDMTFNLADGTTETHTAPTDDWKVTIVDTGEDTMTGGRVKRIRPFLTEGEAFFLTYGDGVSDVDLTALLKCHEEKSTLVTLSAIFPPARFGELNIEDGLITSFKEKKNENKERRVNGGFMVMQPDFLDYIEGDTSSLEKQPLETAANMGQLAAYKHDGFWQCMDKLYDKKILEDLWEKGQAPWRVWDKNTTKTQSKPTLRQVS